MPTVVCAMSSSASTSEVMEHIAGKCAQPNCPFKASSEVFLDPEDSSACANPEKRRHIRLEFCCEMCLNRHQGWKKGKGHSATCTKEHFDWGTVPGSQLRFEAGHNISWRGGVDFLS